METSKKGDLKVWWIPQVPMKSFEHPVKSVQEGLLLLDALAKYDLFQYENKVKGDYCNAGGLVEYDPELIEEDDEDFNGWSEWYSPTGDDIDFYLNSENPIEKLEEDLKFEFKK